MPEQHLHQMAERKLQRRFDVKIGGEHRRAQPARPRFLLAREGPRLLGERRAGRQHRLGLGEHGHRLQHRRDGAGQDEPRGRRLGHHGAQAAADQHRLDPAGQGDPGPASDEAGDRQQRRAIHLGRNLARRKRRKRLGRRRGPPGGPGLGQDAQQAARAAARLFDGQALGGEGAFGRVQPGQAVGGSARPARAAQRKRAGAEQRLRHRGRQLGFQGEGSIGARRGGRVAHAPTSAVSPASPEGRSAGVRKRSSLAPPGSSSRQGSATENSVSAPVG